MNKNGAPEQWTEAELVEAIRESGGIVTDACRLIGCSRKTFYEYEKRYPSITKAKEESRESMDEDVVDMLRSIMMDRSHKDQLGAIKYYTGCRMGWRVDKGLVVSDGSDTLKSIFSVDQ
jgi:transposase-like protein